LLSSVTFPVVAPCAETADVPATRDTRKRPTTAKIVVAFSIE